MALDDGSLDFDLLAASLRADAGDLDSFCEVLATKLESTLPNMVTVDRVKQGFRGPRVVRGINVDAGSERLTLVRNGPRVEATRARTSGGIVLKTEQLHLDDWLGALVRTIEAEAQRSAITRQALAGLLDTA